MATNAAEAGSPSGSGSESRALAEFAHDVKNPLSIAKGACESLQELLAELRDEIDAQASPEVAELMDDLAQTVELIERNSNRALDIAVDTLERARGKTRVRERVDVNEVVAQHATVGERDVGGINVRVDRDLGSSAGHIVGSSSHLGRAVANLIDNALDAAAQEARRGGEGYEPLVQVRTSGDDDGVVVQVEDNGVGLPKHLRDGVVRPFETTKKKGTGLGLAISADVAAAHGGQLRLGTSATGTTVVELWLAREATGPS
jgi:signal transduction histidine kinase